MSRDRLSLILAVLSKHTPINPFSVNVHTNVVGGLQMKVRQCASLMRRAQHEVSFEKEQL